MPWIPDRYRELRSALRSEKVEADVNEEFEHHLAMRTEMNLAAGMSPEEARLDAIRRFGDVETLRRTTRDIARSGVRERRRTEYWDAIRRDVRHAVRGLIRARSFTIVAVLTLALGIGANSAIFSVVKAVLLRPIAVPWLDRMVAIRDDLPALGLRNIEMSPGETVDLAARRDLFESLAAYDQGSTTITGQGDPLRVGIARTMGDFFGLFGGRAVLGRFFSNADSRETSAPVVVLGYDLWQGMSGDRAIVGRTIELNGVATEVIGVAAPNFHFPRKAQLWTPLRLTARIMSPEQRGSLYMTVVARLRPGISQARLDQQLHDEAIRWRQRYNNVSEEEARKGGQTVVAVPFVQFLAGDLRLILLVLSGAVALVLLVACANVASLDLVRGIARSKEFVIRTALGAGRWPIVRQLLVESVLLAIAGGVVGLALGEMALRLLAHAQAAQYPMLTDARFDGTVLLFTGGIALVAGILFGTVPALRASRAEVHDVLKDGIRGTSAGRGRQRFLQGAVVAQVGLALVLLLGSGLMIRSLSKLIDTDPGFHAAHVLTFRLSIPGARYQGGSRKTAYYDQLLARLGAIPGVQAVGIVDALPVSDGSDSSPFTLKELPKQPGDPERHANLMTTGGDYFKAMGIPIRRGRVFDETDGPTTPHVAVIDETLAKQYFHDIDPLGKTVSQGRDAQIIGVVGSVKQRELGAPDKATIYYLYRQNDWYTSFSVALRSDLSAASLVGPVRTAMAELDRNVAPFEIATMQEQVDRSLDTRRLTMFVMGGFAGLSLLLAVLGLYGVISYGTRQRTQEFGIRIALGAQVGDVTRMVLQTGIALTSVGLVVGVLLFLGVSRVLDSLLFGVGQHDPATFGIAILVLGVVAVLASYLPARRAAHLDPVVALRAD